MARTSVSITDVAARAGVSRATVSRVLNGRKTEQIAAETRRRVESVVAEMGYYPNALARGLARNRTNSIGLVFLHYHYPNHTSESFVMMMDGILAKATLCRKDTLFCTSYSWSDGREHISALLDRRCDGLILVVPRTDTAAVPMLKEYEIPFVLLASRSYDPAVSFVDTDNVGAAKQQVRYLMEMGHRRIAFLWMSDGPFFTYATSRLEGYRLAHAEMGLECDPGLLVQINDWETDLNALMNLPTGIRPTALFGVCDSVALNALDHLRRAGWRIPEDVSVVGYDDIPSAGQCAPGLTTIRQPLKSMGERCVEILLDLIEEKIAPGQKETMPTEFVSRQSVAPPQDSDHRL